MCTCYPHLSLHKKHLAQLSDHFSISSLSMLAVIDHVSIWSITASGLAKNEDGKKALSKQLPKELKAEVKWSHVACKEEVLFTFFDHGNMRDCFKGSSLKGDLILKLCKLDSTLLSCGRLVAPGVHSNSNEVKLLEEGFSEFAVGLYFCGDVSFDSTVYSLLLEERAPFTVSEALSSTVNEMVLSSHRPSILKNVFDIFALVLDLVFNMKAAGFSIQDAGPNNLAYFPEGARSHTAVVLMLDFEHITKGKQLRKKQNETFLRSISQAVSCMLQHPALEGVGNMLRRVVFAQWFLLANDADVSSKDLRRMLFCLLD